MKTFRFVLAPLVLALLVLLTISASAFAQGQATRGTDVAVEGYATLVGKDLIEYEIEVMNLGSAKSMQVNVTHTLSTLTVFRSVKTSNGQCTGGPIVQCYLKKLPTGKTMVIEVFASRVRVPCFLDCQAPITSQVTVTSKTFDPNLSNNSYSVTVH